MFRLSSMNTGRAALCATLLLLNWAATLSAQTSATITGTVRDATGAVVTGATVVATNEATGLVRRTRTNAEGDYSLPSLPVGLYTLRVEQTGFKQRVIRGIELQVSQEPRVDVALELGETSESITVTSDAPLLQSENSSVGTVINNTFNRQIPLNGRDFSQLILLVPGANDSRTSGATNTTVGSGVSINGRDNQNNFMFDGASNNARQFGNIAIKPSIDAIQEFKVLSNSYSAEYGQAAAAQINLISKTGTNEIHGVLFHFLRNDAMDARNFFLPTVAQLNRNQFGGSLGGPIRRNKTFFFANYEGSRERRGATGLRSVPPANWRRGDFSDLLSGPTPVYLRDPASGRPCTAADRSGCFPGNVIPENRIRSEAKAMLALWPAANFGSASVNNLIITRPIESDSDQITGNVNHNFGEKNRIAGRYSVANLHQVETPDLPGFETLAPPRNHSAVITDTHVFSPTLLMELQASFTRSVFRVKSINSDTEGYYSQFGINQPLAGPQFEGAPRVAFQRLTLSSFGDGDFIPNNDINNEYTYAGTLTWNRGSHGIKTGSSLTFYQQNTPGAVPGFRRGQYIFRGDYTNHAFADFLLGAPFSAQRTVGPGVETGRSRWYAAFLQDDWKVTSRLTLNLGVRYDYTSPLVDILDRRSTLYPLTNDFGTGQTGEIIVASSEKAKSLLGLEGIGARSLYRPDRNNFAPRIGFALRLSPKTVVRSGYGIFFANTQNLLNNFVMNRRQPPYAETQLRQAQNLSVPDIDLANPFVGAGPPAVVGTNNVDPNFRDGYMQQWNFTLQRELPGGLSVEAAYAGNKGSKLSEIMLFNVPLSGPAATVQQRRRLPAWGQAGAIVSRINSNYNSLQLKVEKRYSGGLSLLGAYTWSKAIDESSERGSLDRLASGGNMRDIKGYFRGLSGFDTRHRLVVSYVYELPFGRNRKYGSAWNGAVDAILGGWEIAGITSFQAGFPFSVAMSGDQNGDGMTNDRPDVIGTPQINPGNPGCYIVTGTNLACGSGRTSAFAPAPATRFGNAGRNILIGPGLRNWDLAILKTFSLTERFRLQLRGEGFNAFNNVNFSTPQRTLNVARFGEILSAGRSREMQVGLKLEF